MARVARVVPWVIAAAAVAADAPAQAQSNLDAGKSAAQIFADTCNACHRGPREVRPTSAAFLREHYTTGPRKRRQWPLIWPRSGAMRGRSNSGGPPRWARARRPRRGPTKATAVGRPSRVSRRPARPPPARSGLGFPPRVWKRAICRLLPRREAPLPRLVRRKPPWPRRRGRAASKPSRNRAKTATAAELASCSPAVVSDKRQSRNLSARFAPTRSPARDRHSLAACAAQTAATPGRYFFSASASAGEVSSAASCVRRASITSGSKKASAAAVAASAASSPSSRATEMSSPRASR